VDILKVIDPGDEVILPSPTYSTHIQRVIIASGKPVLVPTIEEEGFIWDIDRIKDAITSRTTPGIAFGPTGEGHLRVSFCVSEEEINIAFDRMEPYFR
jgi:aspartate/methionine/tyrosine aminotransferase